MSKIILGLVGFAYGLFLFIIRYKKHRTINSTATAEVTEVRKLGFDDGHKSYAVFYRVDAAEPFEICKTPVKRKSKIGKREVIFFDSNNPKNNYYFKKLGRFDHRLIMPISVIGCGILVLVYSIISLF